MAKKRRKRRHSKGLSSGHKTKGRRRRRPRKSFLSASISTSNLMESAKDVGAAYIGGTAAWGANKIMPKDWGFWQRFLAGGAVSFTAAVFGFKRLAIGYGGGTAALSLEASGGGLKEETNFADQDALNENTPLFLDASGQPMVLEEDSKTGESYYRYLNDHEKELVAFPFG